MELAQQIVECGKIMFERRLTDLSGGNISARAEDRVYITPRYAGSRQYWQLISTDILSGPITGDVLLSEPGVSREAGMHLAIYHAFSSAKAVIHAHPFHIQPFAAARKPIPPVLEAAEAYGVVDFSQYAASHTPELGAYVVEALVPKAQNIRQNAAAVLIPRHGIVIASRDLKEALLALEIIDWNAWCILAGKWL